MKKVLVILFDKVEEVEAFAPVDILRRAGADVQPAGEIAFSRIRQQGDDPFTRIFRALAQFERGY